MTSENSTHDDQLIRELREGREDAFRQVVAQHQQRVINICYRFVLDRAEAEDLAQETFIEIHRSIESFRGQSSLTTWIYRIAVTKSLDFIRKQGRAKRGGGLSAILRLDHMKVDLPAPASVGPDRMLAEQERKGVLGQALNTLPEKQRIAFVLSKYDGISYQEIAEVLKTSLSSVESLIHRARNNLQKQLRSYYEKTMGAERPQESDQNDVK
ncbi:MAG TPA: sigma-70 family RNA polymerase sigma factor [Candidatus Acidoferrum sp.]|nr:sigma-70 family RNA polymerase sigma factor [Candidatus Acidoferrum sp.]